MIRVSTKFGSHTQLLSLGTQTHTSPVLFLLIQASRLTLSGKKRYSKYEVVHSVKIETTLTFVAVLLSVNY